MLLIGGSGPTHGSTTTGCEWRTQARPRPALSARAAPCSRPLMRRSAQQRTGAAERHATAQQHEPRGDGRLSGSDPRDRRCRQRRGACGDRGTVRRLHRDRRWRIEHAQVVDPPDIARFGQHGIIASMQPSHQPSDRLMAEARLGPSGSPAPMPGARSATRARRWRSARMRGRTGRTAGRIAAAIAREDAAGQPPGGWQPQQRVTRAEALAAFTAAAAHAGFGEGRFGRLARANAPTSWCSTPIRCRPTRPTCAGSGCWKPGSAARKCMTPVPTPHPAPPTRRA